MATRPKKSESERLEQYRVSLENAESHPVTSSTMAEFGYDQAKITEGKELWTKTRSVYDFNKTEDDETTEASKAFSTKLEELEDFYKLHRKKAKQVFRKDNITADKLGVLGEMPRLYVPILEAAKKFYAVALSDDSIQTKLAQLKVTSEELTKGNTLISKVESARSEYLKENGESQDATKQKAAAFIKMDDWMRDFYGVARIAFEDNPQLLEVLGIFVRS